MVDEPENLTADLLRETPRQCGAEAPAKPLSKKLVLGLLAVTVAAVIGGSYFYGARTLRLSTVADGASVGGGEKPTPVIQADSRPSKEMPGNPGGRQLPNGEKAIYERLTPDGPQLGAFSPSRAQGATAFTAPVSGGNSSEDRIDDSKGAERTGDAPAAPPRPSPDQPTVVPSESYRPDGTRVDTARPATLAAAIAPAPKTPPAWQARQAAAAEPAPAAADGFFVSLKSAPDEKEIQRELPRLADKYKSVLGYMQLTTSKADLGAKGVFYRAVAGPLGTRQEAMDLCQNIKGVAGEKACFVMQVAGPF